MPVRAVVTLVATFIVLVLLVSFRTPPSNSLGVLPPVKPSATSTAAPTPTASGAPPGGGSPTPSPAGSGLKDGSFTGQDFPNFYGDVQVKIVVFDGKVTDVVALRYPTDRPQSAYISSVAVPLLRTEVLQAQSARIDGISGATFTSESYAQSVQSALGLAHA